METAGNRVALRRNSLLVSGASRACTHGATGFTWIDVTALTTALCPGNVGEHFLVRNVVSVDAIANRVVILRTGQNAGHGARGDIGHVVRNTAAVGETSSIARQQTQDVCGCPWGGSNACIQTKHIGNGTSRCSRGGDGRRIGYQRQQVCTRRSGNRNAVDRVQDSSEERVQIKD